MPSAASYTNKVRFTSSIKNTKAQLQGSVGNLTQSTISGCALDIQYTPIQYVEIPKCTCKPLAPPQLYITTVAGTGTYGYNGDGILATDASLGYPESLTFDIYGNMYIADSGNNRIRKVDKTTGIITTVAGNGIEGYNGDGILATSASLYYPTGVAFDSSGNMYITDNTNHRIRKVDKVTGIITTVAGNGIAEYNGDGILATSASLNSPRGNIVFDSVGNMYISDSSNFRIRKVDTSGIITTIAGNGTYGYNGDGILAISANISYAYDISIDSSGNLYIADTTNFRLRKVDKVTGIITTVAGNGTDEFGGDGGQAISAGVIPFGIDIDSSGNMYITGSRVRKVDKVTGIINTIAGNGIVGYNGDDILAISANLNGFRSKIYMDEVYIADSVNNRIRKLYYA